MTSAHAEPPMSASEPAAAMSDYIREGTERAYALDNRGPIRFDADGRLHRGILDAYWRTGICVFEDVVGAEEQADLRADVKEFHLSAARRPGGPQSLERGDQGKGPQEL